MKAQLIKIGNSKGIRLPKIIIEQCKLEGDVELEVKNNKLLLYSHNQVRHGWTKSFKRMHDKGDDVLLDNDMIESLWDDTEWTW